MRLAGFLICILAFALCGTSSFAQAIAVEKSVQTGRVVVDDAIVYSDPDFDSAPLGSLRRGTTWTISKRVFGAFYQIHLPKGRLGYVTDADVRSLAEIKKLEKKVEAGAHFDMDENLSKKRQFQDQDFQGISFLNLRYREETMGLRPTDNMLLLGYKATGSDVVIEGLTTELNAQISLGAPRYYEEATSRSADGFLFLLDMMLLNAQPRGANTMTFWGVGPVFRFSKFNVTLPVNGNDEYYSLDDMTLGLKFNLGLAQRFDPVAVRVDFQYFWEKLHYYGFSVSVLHRF